MLYVIANDDPTYVLPHNTCCSHDGCPSVHARHSVHPSSASTSMVKWRHSDGLLHQLQSVLIGCAAAHFIPSCLNGCRVDTEPRPLLGSGVWLCSIWWHSCIGMYSPPGLSKCQITWSVISINKYSFGESFILYELLSHQAFALCCKKIV